MRIGIVSLPVNFNYGGLLQAFALRTVLQRMGHCATIIAPHVGNVRDWFIPPFKSAPLAAAKHYLKTKILRHGRDDERILSQIEWAERHNRFLKEFISNRLCPLTGVDYCELKAQDYDALFAGSDQVWRPRYFGFKGFKIPYCITARYFRNAYLRFARKWNVRRVAYAASFGTDKWEYPWLQTRLCGRLLRKFDAVSVREKSAVEIVKRRFGVCAQHLLDPTMLLSAGDYSQLIGSFDLKRVAVSTPPDCNSFIINYLLDNNKNIEDMLSRVEKAVSMPMVSVNDCASDASGSRVATPVEVWLRLFRDCKYVVTDSFHGCVFSILFQKQFIVTGNKERGNARFDSLLGTFGLEDRLVSPADDCVNTLLKPIDYEAVTAKLDALRKRSMDFLTSNLPPEA